MEEEEATSRRSGPPGEAAGTLLKAEYDAVRTEIQNHQTRRDGYLAAALTATGAIGSVALSDRSNLEALLILPILLSGLALMYLKHTVDTEHLGEYLRIEYWPVLRDSYRDLPGFPTGHQVLPDRASLLAWDDWIQKKRTSLGRTSPYGLLGIIPPLLIFAAASFGSLVLTSPSGRGSEWRLVWSLDVFVLALSVFFTGWVTSRGPGWKKPDPALEYPFHRPDLPAERSAVAKARAWPRLLRWRTPGG